MDIVRIIITSLGSIVTLFLITKLVGNREMSQLSMFDYINSITVGSIAAEMATTEFTETYKAFTAMAVYGIAITLIAKLSAKSIVCRRLICGHSCILYDGGSIYFKNLRKNHIELNEMLAQCRVSGYFDLSNLQTVILEENGKMSFLPLADQRPVNATDLGLRPPKEYLVANVILDGNIMKENLKHTGKNEKWLYDQLRIHGISSEKEVLLATCDINNKVCVYKKDKKITPIDILD